MKNTIVKIIVLSFCLFSLIGCTTKKGNSPGLELTSLYDDKSNSFVLDGYAPATDWQELSKDLNINLDMVKQDENRYYIDNIVEIYPKSNGFISLGKVIIDDESANVIYSFYQEKLYAVNYHFELSKEENEQRINIATNLNSDLDAIFTGFISNYENKIGGFDTAYYKWFTGSQGTMSCLTLSTSTDSDTGELQIDLSVTCDIPGNEFATTIY